MCVALPVIGAGLEKVSFDRAMIATSLDLHSETAIVAAISAELDPVILG